MKTLYMMKGLPASGKSTQAKKMLVDMGHGNVKIVNKDSLRAMLDDGHHSRENEQFVIGVRDYVVAAALNAGKHVIVDDTNLAPKHQDRLRSLAKTHGAAFETVDFTHVSLSDCIERDRRRQNYVGEQVIRSMWKQFLATPIRLVQIDPRLPYCIVVDVDGTCALMNGGRGPFEWHKVSQDSPNEPVVSLLHMVETAKIIYVSARDECCRADTEEWLREYASVVGELVLHMRPAGDTRDDRIVKREIYEREIQGKYNVDFVLDDRTKVVEMWRQLGLACFQVAEGDF